MKKTLAIQLDRLRNEEAYTFHKEVSLLASAIKAEKIRPLAAAYNAAFAALSDAIDKHAGQTTAAAAKDADAARDASWQGANAYAKCLANYSPAQSERAAAETIYSLFEKYGNPVKLSLAQETGVIDNLVQSIEALDPAALEACRFAPWLADLKEKQAAYEKAAQASVSESAAKVLGAVKAARAACDEAYAALAAMVSAMALIQPDAEFDEFTSKANVIIEKQKAVIKNRNKAALRAGEPAAAPQ